jgi:ABC-2 type transport system ATP-binding protein
VTIATGAIRLEHVTKRYGKVVALDDLSLAVQQGVFGFLGPNGAGKTTAVKILLGLTRPTSGSGSLAGFAFGSKASLRRIGYLPELFRYQSWLTAREVLALHCELARIDRARWPSEIDRILATVGLADRGTSRVGTFSKGMQQRLGLGVALLDDPMAVLLDEPTSALDPVGRHDVREIIRALREKGTIVFLNSHLLSEVEQVCDAVAIVDRGRVVAQGDLAQLLGVSSVRVRATGISRDARADMARFGQLDDGADGELVIKGIERERIPELVSAIVASGARVYAVEPQHESLEERFLSLLGQ